MADDAQIPADESQQPEDATLNEALEADVDPIEDIDAGLPGDPGMPEDADETEAEAMDLPAPAVAAAPASFDAGLLLQQLGDDQRVLAPFASGAVEVLQVGVETVAGQPGTVEGVMAALTEYEAIQRDFEAQDHVGLELRVALSETEAQLAAALLPLEDAGRLFGIDTSADAMADETFAAAQLQTIDQRVRELLDLVSLTLFGDALAGAEVTVSEVRRGQIDWTLGMVQDVAQGAPPVRVDFTVAMQDGASVPMALVLPSSLLGRFIDILSPAEAASTMDAGTANEASTVQEPVAAPVAGAASFEMPADQFPPNISAFPPAGGRSPFEPADSEPQPPLFANGDDASVHPVRFPPLPESVGREAPARPIDLIMDVSMRVTVELGRSSLTVEEILELGPGSVVELNKLAGEPVDILVNDRLIARGEVVVVDENFGVRVTEIISPRQRASAMSR
ncbi:MAG: flagellar motor switch protein FliN [Dehalococcoidia bacterium]